MTGEEADKFLLNVQEAAAGHPWYTHETLMVNNLLQICNLMTVT